MGSSRLPGKVLMPLAGKPALGRMIDRIKPCKYIDEIVVCTTINKKDDQIVSFCKINKVTYYRGSEKNVLKRILEGAKKAKAQTIVVLTGDCPLIDFRHINRAIKFFFKGKYDYVSNAYKRSYPDGFDTQVLKVSALEKADKSTNDPIDRVHPTYFIFRNPDIFKLGNIMAKGKMYWPDLGVTLDEKDDYKLINIIFENLLRKNRLFSAKDVVDFLLKNPKLIEINKHVRRKKAQEG